MMKRIGLTGGIGSGKSTVANLLRSRGSLVIDTDLIARELTYANGAAIPALISTFGADVLDAAGGLDRPRMRALAFSDSGVKTALEAILHPLIWIETERQAKSSLFTTAIFDVPLLVESARWRERVDHIWIVDCSPETQIERVAQRPGWSDALARSVIAQQANRPQRLACADAVIYNDAISLEDLAAQVDALKLGISC